MIKLPKKRYFGMTWLGWINIVLQFLFIRLAFCGDSDKRTAHSAGILFGAFPLTGWSWSPFKKYWPFVKYIHIKKI